MVLAALALQPAMAPGQTVEQRLDRAWSSVQQRQYDPAIAECNEILRRNPASDRAYNTRGAAWYCKKEYDRALADYNEAIRFDPRRGDSFANRSDVWLEKNRYDLAMADANEAVRLAPGEFLTYRKRGNTWRKQGDYSRAVADYDVAVNLGTNVDLSYRVRASLLATCPDARYRDGQRAFADASKAYQLSPIIIRSQADPDGPYGPASMETFAAAYAENGDFKAAESGQGNRRTVDRANRWDAVASTVL